MIACVGVAVPLAGGTLLYSLFYGFSALGSQEFYRALFIGTIMTATSVSITVATLQELGHLKSFLGTTIVSAAVIDDVIGIVVLTCVLGASSGTGTGLGKVLMNTVLFFATAIGVGLIAHYAMKWLDKRNPHTSASPSSVWHSALPWPTSLRLTSALQTSPVLHRGHRPVHSGGCPLCGAPGGYQQLCAVCSHLLRQHRLKTDISGLTPEILLFSVCFVVVA